MHAGEPFDLDGAGTVGAVVIHGFTGTPFEVRFLGEQLARAGITARGVLLPGHGTSPADLARTTWQDWAGGVERAVDALAARCAKVVLVGQSLGGLLALHVAARRGGQIAAVAALATPLWLDGLASLVARWTGPGGGFARVPFLPKLGSDVRDRDVRRANPGYTRIPTAALAELVAFMPVVDAELGNITAPVLVIHAQHDHTAPIACAYHLATRTRARLEILPQSYHLIAADVEKERVAALVTDFIHEHAKETVRCAT